MKKILWVKFGWSEYYRGGLVDGNFGWLNENRGRKNEGRGHEAYNFMPAPDGDYRCYVPPQAKRYAPRNDDSIGWTVICLAKHPKYKGIHIVGWYEDANLLGTWQHPPEGELGAADVSYCVVSSSALFVPPEKRTRPFSDKSVRQGKYSFLAGPGVKKDDGKRRVLRILEARLKTLRGDAIQNPSDENLPSPETDIADPLTILGTAEHRREVELAAERAVVAFYRRKGFSKLRVANQNCGYDYVFKKGRTALHVEVKGTSTAQERLFMTKNENGYRSDPRWRLGMVTDALSEKPRVRIYDNRGFEKAFDLEPLVFVGRRVVEP
jgi:hypothetical protein